MKNEEKTTTLEKLGYGLKYTLAISTAILAMCASCFIFISVTTYFAPPLQPIFDQERLGQLGDFLGGTLNPIFGFTTVCLLLWSVFMQRKELAMTLSETKQSTQALKDQVRISLGEYNRKQLNEFIQEMLNVYQNSINDNFDPISLKFIDTSGNMREILCSSIKQILDLIRTNYKYSDIPLLQFKDSDNSIHKRLKIIILNIEATTTNIADLTADLIEITHLTSIKTTIYSRSKEMLEMGLTIGIIDQVKANSLLLNMAQKWHNDFVKGP